MLSRKEVSIAWRECNQKGFSRMSGGLFLQTVGEMKKEWWWNDEEEEKLNNICLHLFFGMYEVEDDDIFLLTDTGIDPIYIASFEDLLFELEGMVEEEYDEE